MKKLFKKIKTYLSEPSKTPVPLIRLDGVIGGKGYGKKGVTLEALKPAFDEAFGEDKADIVLLVINSPGGSPAQSSLIYKYLCGLKCKQEKQLLVFIEDVAASGGYYIACAGDKIYADDHSVTGSIGVVSGGFGFVEAIKKLGVERRLYTSGTNKAMLDPFSPEKGEDIAHLKEIQADIHSVFKDVVMTARGNKLVNPDENELFSGKFWTSSKAKSFGLIDDITTIEAILFEKYGEDYKINLIDTDKRGFFERKFGLAAEHTAQALIKETSASIEEYVMTKKMY